MTPQPSPESVLVAAGEGLGNRFLVADGRRLEEFGVSASALAAELCGDAWDGLLVVGAPVRRRPRQRVGAWVPVVPVEVVNRDGSAGGTCLNGLRVVAALSGDPGGVFQMDGRWISWLPVEEGYELMIAGEDLPAAATQPEAFEVDGQAARAVGFWNPHCVVRVPDVDAADLVALAAAATASGRFPDGVNLEAVSAPRDGPIRMRVLERGVGETQACGSGAVAVALAAWADGAEGALEVQMPGGSLQLQRAPDGGVALRGPARPLPLPGHSEGA